MNSLALSFNYSKTRAAGLVVTARGTLTFSEACPAVAIFGPSGAGKSSLLRWIAGLDRADVEELNLISESGSENWIGLRPQDRRLGYVTQGYALFPHLDVRENIGYGLRSLPAAERDARVEELLKMFELMPQAAQVPATLSGGQKQRVSFARALAIRPRLLLLDEPFAALDYPTRERLMPELVRWLRRFQVPALIVTHDPREAAALGAPMFSFEGHHLDVGLEKSPSVS